VPVDKIDTILNKLKRLRAYSKQSIVTGLVARLVYLEPKKSKTFLNTAPVTVRVNTVKSAVGGSYISVTPLHARSQTTIHLPLDTYGEEWVLKRLEIKQK
jgi:hypothetical protein